MASIVPRLQDQIEPTFARSFLTGTSSVQLAAEMVDRLASELMKVPARV